MKLLRHSLLCVMFALCAWAQTTVAQTVIRGEIVDANNGDPLIGASIIQKTDPSTGTVTDYDGSFELKLKDALPITVICSYIGYADKEISITDASNLKVELSDDAVTLDVVVEVKGQAVSEKQQAAPLTVESMGLAAIKAAPADNFYDALGSMKGVDMTAASLGFKIINTRGFNSTSPVRSLQLIDGVDNQSPGLNFSLGNFLGTSELDVLKVDLVQGASSAFYGPNAFNGVISISTKDPFFQKGLSGSVKVGERNMLETAVRWADTFNNKDGFAVVGYKLNVSYLRADDWEADNYDPVFDTDTGFGNPGRFDAVNAYGDEYANLFDYSDVQLSNVDEIGLGIFHRTAYREEDIVNYDTRNLKTNVAVHYRLNPEMDFESPEAIASYSFSNGTTVYQGDNRFSLNNIQFQQGRLELRKKNKWFVRAYATQSDAGESYDPYFTALRLQEAAKDTEAWRTDYYNFWRSNFPDRMVELGYPESTIARDEEGNIIFDENGAIVRIFDEDKAVNWLTEFNDTLTNWHSQAEAHANKASGFDEAFYAPGTERFDSLFNAITTGFANSEGNGTRFFDRSALYHLQGEYKFGTEFFEEITVGASGRYYRPNSRGTIFFDSTGVSITNYEFGAYAGVSKKLLDDRLTASATLRADKNENFDVVASPAVSLVYKPRPGNYLRLSFSSAVRNPTLTDQYLSLNVGRAILSGNLNGVDSLIEINSFIDFLNTQDRDQLDFFNIDPIKPERVKTFEVGYRTTLWNALYVDAGYYFSFYQDFIGYNIGIETAFDDFGNPNQPQVYRYSANSTNEVTTQGFNIGLSYYFWDYFQLSGNYSWNRLNSDIDDPIIPAFNTPENKFNIGFSGKDIELGPLKNLGFSLNYKWIEGFLFEGSPQFTGFIPTYDLLDAQVNYQFKKANLTWKVGASNVLNNESFQAYGGPRIGRLAYTSLVYEFKKK